MLTTTQPTAALEPPHRAQAQGAQHRGSHHQQPTQRGQQAEQHSAAAEHPTAGAASLRNVNIYQHPTPADDTAQRRRASARNVIIHHHPDRLSRRTGARRAARDPPAAGATPGPEVSIG